MRMCNGTLCCEVSYSASVLTEGMVVDHFSYTLYAPRVLHFSAIHQYSVVLQLIYSPSYQVWSITVLMQPS